MMYDTTMVCIPVTEYKSLVRAERDRELFKKFVEIKGGSSYGLLTDDVRFVVELLGTGKQEEKEF